MIVERFKFNSRSRKPSEKMLEYLAALRKLSEYCEFGNSLDQMIRDRLVCGINPPRIEQRLFAEGSTLTLEKARTVTLSMEAAEENSSIHYRQDTRACGHALDNIYRLVKGGKILFPLWRCSMKKSINLL